MSSRRELDLSIITLPVVLESARYIRGKVQFL